MVWSRVHRMLPKGSFDPKHPVRSLARWPLWLVSIARGKPVNAQFVTGGMKMRLMPKLRSFGSTSIYIRRDFYEPELLAIRPFVRPGSVALDIGGSFGIFSLFMSEYVGKDGHVYAFEPGKYSFGEISHNVALNRRQDRITVFNVAASDKPATLSLVHLGDAPVTFSIGEADSTRQESETVEAKRVDSLVPREDWERVSFIKIDVEGYERSALEGARGVIEAAHPTIMFEVCAEALGRQGLTPADMRSFLGSFGYSFFRLNPEGGFDPVEDLPEDNVFAFIGSPEQASR